jgi:zinc/manganese transport system substrate-binding protein
MRTILNMRGLKTSVLVAVVALALPACGPEESGDDRPLVIATTTILGDIVRQTAGRVVDVEVLMPVGADPHDFAASAQQAARLRRAALVVVNGVGLEAGLLDVIEAAETDGVAVLRFGEGLDPLPFAGTHADDHEEELDPHVWMDPVRVADGVTVIAERLLEVAAIDVREAASAYRAEVLGLHDEIATMVELIPLENRKLVTNHFSYGYFANRYGLDLLGTVIPAATTAAETSAAGFAALVDLLGREQISVVFGSTTEPATLAKALTEEVGYEVRVVELYTGSLGEPGSGAETYVDMMRTSAQLIVESLR